MIYIGQNGERLARFTRDQSVACVDEPYPGAFYVRIGVNGKDADAALMKGVVTEEQVRRRAVPYADEGITTQAAVDAVVTIMMGER